MTPPTAAHIQALLDLHRVSRRLLTEHAHTETPEKGRDHVSVDSSARRRPAVEAAIDQQTAAMRDAQSRQVALADALDGTTNQVPWTPALREVLAPLVRLASAGALTTCQHVDWPDRTHWARWRPGRLRCEACLSDVARALRGTREDRRCDRCRRLTPTVGPTVVLLPAAVLDLGTGPAHGFGPIHAHFGVCSPCRAALYVPDHREGETR